MLGFLCKRLIHNVRFVRDPRKTHLGFLQSVTLPIKSFSSSLSKKTLLSAMKGKQKQSFTVSYLMNSCGLSVEKAITVSEKVHFETPDRPDSVLKLLRSHGFTNSQITKIVQLRPGFLLADPEKTLSPKLEFYKSIGLSATVFSRIISTLPSLLAYSLVDRIIPSYKFIMSIVNFDDRVAVVVKNNPRLLLQNVQKTIAPNVAFLRDHGVPATYISLMFTRRGSPLLWRHDKFKKCAKEVIDTGFNPSTLAFILALQVTVVMTESTWNHKIELYKRCGWSETDFRAAFRSFPLLMTLSETKVTNAMEFLVKKMGVESAVIARNPSILGLSLEKRIIPRYSVIEFLMLKGLIKKTLHLNYMLITEEAFLDKFVIKYKEDVPELLSVYQGKMRIQL